MPPFKVLSACLLPWIPKDWKTWLFCKSCLKVIRELSGFRYAFAKDAMAETFAPLMASVEAKNELERQGLKVSLKSYFLSLILKDLENPDIVTIDNYINALFNCADAAANGPITVQTVVNVANSFPQDGINWRQNPQTEEEQILLQPVYLSRQQSRSG